MPHHPSNKETQIKNNNSNNEKEPTQQRSIIGDLCAALL